MSILNLREINIPDKPKIKKDPTKIVLELTEDEAKALFMVTGCIAVSHIKSPRKFTDAVFLMLREKLHKIKYSSKDVLDCPSIKFKSIEEINKTTNFNFGE